MDTSKAYAEAVAEVRTGSYGDMSVIYELVGTRQPVDPGAGEMLDVKVRRAVIVPLEPVSSPDRAESLFKAVDAAQRMKAGVLAALDNMIAELRKCRDELASRVLNLRDATEEQP